MQFQYLPISGRAHKLGRAALEATLMLMAQSLQGRFEGQLNAKELLLAPTRVFPSGATVVAPASAYAKKVQMYYAEFFGQRFLPGRSLDWKSPTRLVKARLALEKPKLFARRKSSGNTELARIKAHGDAVQVVAEASGSTPQGCRKSVLGGDLPAAAASAGAAPIVDAARRVLETWAKQGRGASAADGSDEDAEPLSELLRKRKAAGTEPDPAMPPSPKRGKTAPAAASSASGSGNGGSGNGGSSGSGTQNLAVATGSQKSTDVRPGPGRHKQTREDAIAKQANVATRRLDALINSGPTAPTPYVDPQGGMMRSRAVPRISTALPAAPLPATGSITVRMSHGCRKMPPTSDPRIIPATSASDVPDIVLVTDLVESWTSHYAFLARLYGSRLVDMTWLASRGKSGVCVCVCFSPAIQQHRVFYVTQRFQNDRKEYVAALHQASSKAGVIRPGKSEVPRFEVVNGEPPATLAFPRCTYTLVAREGKVYHNPLDLKALVSHLTFLCAGQKLPPTIVVAAA